MRVMMFKGYKVVGRGKGWQKGFAERASYYFFWTFVRGI